MNLNRDRLIAIASKPGWLNFLWMLLVWIVSIFIYISLSTSRNELHSSLVFYARFTWLNFLLWYFLSIWIMPRYLERKQYWRLALATFFAINIYIFCRWRYHIFLIPDYYTTWLASNEHYPTPVIDIINMEAFRGIQFALFALGYSTLFLFVFAELRRSRLEKEKLVAELSALRYQLNPHFLFNGLNNIYYLAIIKSDTTVDAIVKLSEMLRYVLDEKNDLVPLRDELNYINEFLEFHKFRYPDDRISFEKSVDPQHEFDRIPALSLLTFLENAFKHGDANKENGDGVRISLKVENGELDYEVINKIGEGISKDKSSSIGLANLKKRLKLLFPGKFKLTTQQIDDAYYAKLYLQLESYDKSNSH